MIYDTIENIKNYKGISEYLDEAIDYITSHDLKSIGLSKESLDSNVRYFGQEYIGKAFDVANYEVHHDFIDIQIVVEGKERMCSIPSNGTLEPLTEFNPEKDVQKFKNGNNASSDVVVSSMEFALFMNNEYHMPGVDVDGKTIKKVVFKVRGK